MPMKTITTDEHVNKSSHILESFSESKNTTNIIRFNRFEGGSLSTSFSLINNCNGQYFDQKCNNQKCGFLLRIYCTEWKACPKCGTKNYGRHYGA
jgi:hypothetical protein